MMKYNDPQQMALTGVKTPQAVIYKSESHKLCQAFPVKEGQTIIQGQPVALNNDGTIQGYAGTGIYLGIAITDSEFPAYPGNEVTVMMEGFAVVYGVATAAVVTGYVTPSAPDEDSLYTKYTNTASSGTTASNFIAISAADAANDLIQVLVK